MESPKQRIIGKWPSVCLIVLSAVGVTKADFFFGELRDIGLGAGGHVSLSADELELYFASARTGLGYEDLWFSTRRSVDDQWDLPVNLETVNSEYREAFPSISPDGLTLYFSDYFYGPDRPGGLGGHDLWMATRANRDDPWGAPVNMGSPFNSPSHDISPTISHDGLTLIFASFRGSGNYDLWMCTRPSMQDPWSLPSNMGPTVNSGSYDYYGNLSADGLVLFFESNRSGTYEGWKTVRRTISDPWEPPITLPAQLRSMGVGCVLGNGSAFYAGMSQVQIVPIVDFNGDGIVDAVDMCVMVDHWGSDYPACDIGPMPWGDGTIDVEDVKVLAGHLFEDVNDHTLVAGWPLDETEDVVVADSVGNNDGYALGNPVWRPDGGVVGGALEFDGVDDVISAPAVLNPASGPFTVLAWVKGGGPGQVIISGSGASDWISLDLPSGSLMTDLKSSGRGAAPLLSQTVIADGNWHRIGLVWDGSYRTLYVDGMAVAEDTQSDLESSASGLYIGCGDPTQPETFFSGLIDDIRIYNRAVNP